MMYVECILLNLSSFRFFNCTQKMKFAMHATRKLWTWLAVICVMSFAVLGWVGTEIYLTAPPIPKQVVSTKGAVLFSEGQVQRGQEAWLAAGGQQLGSVWGHGSYLAPDWSADWLHREALALRAVWAQRDFGKPFEQLSVGQQAELNARLKLEMRGNTYDADSGTITLSPERAEAVQQVARHYTGLFGNEASLDKLREQYAMNAGSLPDPADLQALPAFIFWASWSAATDRPGESGISYTSNWPHEPLVGNAPTAGAGIWSIASIIFMLAAIAGMIFYHSLSKEEGDPTPPKNDPLFDLKPTPSMKATRKYFYVVIGLIMAQVGMGVPALKKPSESRSLIAMVFLAALCIGGFYATSLTWGQKTHYAMIEYWRWWLVHLWVEGFFEVFATAVIALLFTRLGLIRAATANSAIVLETIVFLFGGILGTLHHLYFTGTPTFVIAIGAMFSALEVVPLAMIGVEAWRNYQRSKAAPWVQAYKWPILCFIAVGFWNVVGAGLLGFSINTPIALYYMQGLNMTAAHGHAALFGVYGMLGIGLLLFCLRGLSDRAAWSDKLLAPMFWSLNIGLAMMVFISLVPAGIYQAWASITKGMWFARSPEVIHSPFMETLVWMRVPGDVVFAIGTVFLALFALRLLTGGQRKQPALVPVSRAKQA